MQGFDQEGALRAFGFEHQTCLAVQRWEHDDNPQANQRTDAEYEKRQLYAKEKHDRQEHQQHHRVEHRAEHLLDQKLPDLMDLVQVSGDFTDRFALEEIDRQVEQLVERVGGYFCVQPLETMVDEVAAQVAERRFERDEYTHRDAQDGEGVQIAVIEYAI